MLLRLSPEDAGCLARWCNDNLPPIQPLESYDPTFNGLKEDRLRGRCFVFAGGSSETIFHTADGRRVVYEYRAWHDSCHLKHDVNFSYEGELTLAVLLEREALEMGMSSAGAALIKLDLILHIRHYHRHGEHPVDQIGMIASACRGDIDTTLERMW